MAHEFVSEQVFEALLAEACEYSLKSCKGRRSSVAAPRIQQASASSGYDPMMMTTTMVGSSGTTGGTGGAPHPQQLSSSMTSTASSSSTTAGATATAAAAAQAASSGSGVGPLVDEASIVVSAEMSAAKLERMGYAVGYRWTERLAQTKTWNSLLSQDAAAQTAAQQLEAVKFLCKEVWVQLFGKQIDKLQTNHRGVFVLKDLDLKYLQAFPSQLESSRVRAIQLLAFPCGVIRGCLADLGIPSVVSCDFLADGQTMAACSFNIKVK